MPIIKLETQINADQARVFNLARSIDLHKASTQQTNEEAIAGVTSGLIALGDTVTWRAKHLGVYQNLTIKITSFEYPRYFVDEMLQGAFQRFRHEHLFTVKDGVTAMVDVFDYQSPLGVLGRLADVVFLKAYMTRFLKRRNFIIKEFAETEKWKEILSNDRINFS